MPKDGSADMFKGIMSKGRFPERFVATGSDDSSVESARNKITKWLNESRNPEFEKYGVITAIDLVHGVCDIQSSPVERGKYDDGACLGTIRVLMGMDLDHAYQLRNILEGYDDYLKGTIGVGDNTQTEQKRMAIGTIKLLLPR